MKRIGKSPWIFAGMFVVGLMASPGAMAQPVPPAENPLLLEAFSPVGTWTITKGTMDLDTGSGVWRKTLDAVGAGAASAELKSEITHGTFEVKEDYTIEGSGTALYHMNMDVKAGFAAGFVTASADGRAVGTKENPFTISGKLDPETRVMELDAFKASGKLPLSMIMTATAGSLTVPFGGRIEIDAWSPVSKVGARYEVVGASLVVRASGSMGPYRVSFEASKPIPFRNLFTYLIESVTEAKKPDPRIDDLELTIRQLSERLDTLEAKLGQVENN